jgi:hypothetical protein
MEGLSREGVDGLQIKQLNTPDCEKLLAETIIPRGGRIEDTIDGTAIEMDYLRIYRRKN